MKTRIKSFISSNIPSQGLNSASSFVLVILLSFVLSPSEFGIFSFYWTVFLVGLSLIRACVAEVMINQDSASTEWNQGALRVAVLCSFIISGFLSIGSYLFIHDFQGAVYLGLTVFFAALQDFARFYALKRGLATNLFIAESIGFLLACAVPLLVLVINPRNANSALFLFFMCSLFSFAVFSQALWDQRGDHFKKGWISTHRTGLSSFLVDALIGAVFNLWLATQIVNYLNFQDLGIYRSLTTYFGVASLLANYAKSGFTTRFNESGRPNRMLKQLGAAMIIAPALQAIVLIAAQHSFNDFGALSLGGPVVVLLAMAARVFATLSSLTVVSLRAHSSNYWSLTLARLVSLVPGVMLTITVLGVLGIQGAFFIDFLNYLLMATLPLVSKWKRK